MKCDPKTFVSSMPKRSDLREGVRGTMQWSPTPIKPLGANGSSLAEHPERSEGQEGVEDRSSREQSETGLDWILGAKWIGLQRFTSRPHPQAILELLIYIVLKGQSGQADSAQL